MSHGYQRVGHRPLDHLYRRAYKVGNNYGAWNDGVYVVKRITDSRHLVEKCFKKSQTLNGDAKHEIDLLRQLNHRNTIQFCDAFVDDHDSRNPRASVYMEYCSDGTLDALLECRGRRRDRLPETIVWRMFRQLVNAVVYCQYGIHDACADPRQSAERSWTGIIHRDIKPTNIFLRANRDGGFPDAVLGDFGLATHVNDRRRMSASVWGTPDWQPPEMPDCSFDSDTWAIGAIIQATCLLEWEEVQPKYRRECRDEPYPIRASVPIPEYYSPTLDKACEDLMRTLPKDRPHLDTFAKGFLNKEAEALRYRGKALNAPGNLESPRPNAPPPPFVDYYNGPACPPRAVVRYYDPLPPPAPTAPRLRPVSQVFRIPPELTIPRPLRRNSTRHGKLYRVRQRSFW